MAEKLRKPLIILQVRLEGKIFATIMRIAVASLLKIMVYIFYYDIYTSEWRMRFNGPRHRVFSIARSDLTSTVFLEPRSKFQVQTLLYNIENSFFSKCPSICVYICVYIINRRLTAVVLHHAYHRFHPYIMCT